MLERVIIALAIITFATLAVWIWQRWQLRRRTHTAPGLNTWQPGRPAILYFTTPGCGPCITLQRPALKALTEELGEGQVRVIEIDASAQPSVAQHWGVLSVPTTFVLDSDGRPQAVNNGVALTAQLREQLQGLLPALQIQANEGVCNP